MDQLVAQFSKNKFEEVRIYIKEYKGYDLVDFRIWTDVKGQEDKVPTTKGLAVNVEQFQQFKQAIVDVERVLREHHLLPE